MFGCFAFEVVSGQAPRAFQETFEHEGLVGGIVVGSMLLPHVLARELECFGYRVFARVEPMTAQDTGGEGFGADGLVSKGVLHLFCGIAPSHVRPVERGIVPNKCGVTSRIFCGPDPVAELLHGVSARHTVFHKMLFA